LHHASRALYGSLLEAGIEIQEYHKSFLHAKVAVVDGRWATVGSSNIDPFSLLLAREANVVVDDRAFAAELRASVLGLIEAGARPVMRSAWSKQPLLARSLAWLSYGIFRLSTGLLGYSKEHEAACGSDPVRAAGSVTPAAAGLTEIWQGGRKFVIPAPRAPANTMILDGYADGIGIAWVCGEGSGFRPRVFDPPPLVATFGRSEPVPIFFGAKMASARVRLLRVRPGARRQAAGASRGHLRLLGSAPAPWRPAAARLPAPMREEH
jgi:hypothetical protein